MKTAWLIADEHDMDPDDVRSIIGSLVSAGQVCWVDRDADLLSDEAVEIVEQHINSVDYLHPNST